MRIERQRNPGFKVEELAAPAFRFVNAGYELVPGKDA
jgi:hypothetical protein